LAIQTAEQSVELLKGDSEDGVWARTVLGSLYRSIGDMQSAASVLEDGSAIANRLGTGSLELARLLNVQASTDRRAGNHAAAVKHARESVEIGRRLRSRRHLSQALYTLAIVLIDLSGEKELEEAGEALNESARLLSELNDRRGLTMVTTTRLKLMRATAS
jgi:tetratricopeptide (TPR) repeat protein